MLSAGLGFDRYTILRHIGGCPRCNGALFDSMCICCGWDGSTRPPSRGERTRGARTPTKVSRYG